MKGAVMPSVSDLKKLFFCACLLTVVALFVPTARGESWQAVYSTDFSDDPGWITNVPDQMYWDAGSGLYHLELRSGVGQYMYFEISPISDQSFMLEYDLTMTQADYAVGLSFGLSSSMQPWGATESVWGNFARGDGGTGATVGYITENGFGFFPGPYDYLFSVATRYHYKITYDSSLQILFWEITAGALPIASYQSNPGIGTLTNLNRILCQNENSGGGVAIGLLDNLVLSILVSDCDGDGLTDDDDSCECSEMAETIEIGDCDSGVANDVLDDGCSMMDLITQCGEVAGNHGQFARCVGRLARSWRKEGLISMQDYARIIRCVARGDLSDTPVSPGVMRASLASPTRPQ